MPDITQIRKLSVWIFLIPLLAINLCLFISQNPAFLDNTIFEVDMIGRSGFSIPYLDGSLSISRASRTFPQYLIFKPSMIITAILLYYYWNKKTAKPNRKIIDGNEWHAAQRQVGRGQKTASAEPKMAIWSRRPTTG